MLSAERHARILQALAEAPAVRVAELAMNLGVSDMTIRRDIDLLDEQHLLKKIHGGASRLDVLSSIEPGFASKADKQLEAKRGIALQAAQLIENGMTIALGAGTTTVQLAGHLGQFEGLTVITNSIKAAEALYRFNPGDASVIITGGERTPSEALVGPLSVAAIASLNVDICFMGVHGIHPRGLSSPNLPEAQTNAAFIDASNSLVVLADHSKFGLRALASFAPLDRVDTLITDPGISESTVETYRPLLNEMVISA
ncbi:DeoR/GlpR family DNA-binding transcription regulator [Psychromicrobium sp. YIM B11713]|uniref:DeoR/GlpR family DNA-binding transcription regulator n=1 Tax=Psychromicrobium sp. YIM B11713 TaxID=3145233 RepID=UPI00374FC2FA